ncbi:MAG: flavin reductase [Bacillota bacterium]
MYFGELLEQASRQIGKGAFLTTGERPNVMTIGWAQWGVIWGLPICCVLVRQSRFTHGLIEGSGAFTVSLPAEGTFADELLHCGRVSGRNEDKIKSQKLSLRKPQAGGIAGIDGCALYFECKTVFKTESDLKFLDPGLKERFYNTNQATPDGDPHTLYFGEILFATRA